MAAAALNAEACASGNIREAAHMEQTERRDALFHLQVTVEDIDQRWSPEFNNGMERVVRRLTGSSEQGAAEALEDFLSTVRRVRAVSGSGDMERIGDTLQAYRTSLDRLHHLSLREHRTIMETLEQEVATAHVNPSVVHSYFYNLRPGLERLQGHPEHRSQNVALENLNASERQLLLLASQHVVASWPDVPADYGDQLVNHGNMSYRMAYRFYLTLCNGANLADDMTANRNWDGAFNEIDPGHELTQGSRERTTTKIDLHFAEAMMAFAEQQGD